MIKIEAVVDERFKIGTRVKMIEPSKFLWKHIPVISEMNGRTGVICEIHKGDPMILDDKDVLIGFGSATVYSVLFDIPILGDNKEPIVKFSCVASELELFEAK